MDAGTLKISGPVDIGGSALGVFVPLFRDLIHKNIFSKLQPAEAYKLLPLITGAAVWSVVIVGVAAWVFVSKRNRAERAAPSQTTNMKGDGNKGTQSLTVTHLPSDDDRSQSTKTVPGKGNSVIQEKTP